MKAVTIAAMLGELIETHMEKCDEGEAPHIVSEVHQDCADIVSIASDGAETPALTLTLDDGSLFRIEVTPLYRGVFEEAAPDEPWKDDE